jgi:hypothetical protein
MYWSNFSEVETKCSMRTTLRPFVLKLKALLRKAAERSVPALWGRIASLLNAFTLDECANYFRNAGYASC